MSTGLVDAFKVDTGEVELSTLTDFDEPNKYDNMTIVIQTQ
jgi:hypothetical protein